MGCGTTKQVVPFSDTDNILKGFRNGKDMRSSLPNIKENHKQMSRKLEQIFVKQFSLHIKSLVDLVQIKKKLVQKKLEAQDSLGTLNKNQQDIQEQKEVKKPQFQKQKIKSKLSETKEQTLSREQKIQAGIILLNQRIQNYKIKQVSMQDDGNCQFRAISQQIYGTQSFHEILRAIAVWQLLSDQDSYSFWFDDGDGGLQNFCDQMKNNATWGTELTLKALVDALGITVHILQIYNPDAKNDKMPYYKHNCFITYIQPIHYNAIALD